MPEYTVREGDCLSSIASDHGLTRERIWNHPANASIRKVRQNWNVLNPGDVVFVPDLEPRTETRPTDQRHKFRRKQTPEVLRLVLLDYEGTPRRYKAYRLIVDGTLFSGTTDGKGELEHPIQPDARSGTLFVEDDQFQLYLGCLDPISEVSGVQGRLINLGFDCGEVDGELGPRTADALRDFQKRQGLPVTGELDDATRQHLEQVHGF